MRATHCLQQRESMTPRILLYQNMFLIQQLEIVYINNKVNLLR